MIHGIPFLQTPWQNGNGGAEGWRAGNLRQAGTRGGGRGICRLLRTISHFTYKMGWSSRGKLSWMTILESIGQDARRFRPVRFRRFSHFISEI